jgi:LacI family transcriptional regulator
VFAGKVVVREEARERVLASASELGYVVNGLARSMMGVGRQTMALVVAEMVGPSFAELAAAAEAVATREGLLLMLLTSHGDPAREASLITTLREQRAAGVILVGSARNAAEADERIVGYRDAMEQVGARLVLCGRPAPFEREDVDAVDYDHEGGVHEATRHLLDLGHTKIAFLGYDPGFTMQASRFSGYTRALSERGAEIDDELVVVAANTTEAAQKALHDLLERRPDVTAVVCLTDVIAVGAYRALRARGLRMPEDVSIVGFDDAPFVADLTPPLTTIRAPFAELGRRAAALALGLVTASEHDILGTELIVRGSTARVRSTRR